MEVSRQDVLAQLEAYIKNEQNPHQTELSEIFRNLKLLNEGAYPFAKLSNNICESEGVYVPVKQSTFQFERIRRYKVDEKFAGDMDSEWLKLAD